MRLTKNRKILLALLVIVIAAGAWFYSSSAEKKSAAAAQQVMTPQTATIEESVTAQGTLEAKEYVDVGAQVSGQLKKVHYDIGDTVKKGDLLAEIDPQIYASKVEADQASLKTLQAQLKQSEAQAVLANQQNERNQNLIKLDAVSKEAVEESESAAKVADAAVNALKAQIEQQQSALKGDQANLSYTKIYAPMDGTVASLTTREGQTINSNQQAPVILRIANLDVLTVRAQVAEADVMRLSTDMDVYFTTLGALEKRWKGKIRQIQPTPEVINDVVLFDALIDVDNKDRQLMLGMSTQIFFILGHADNVMTIPVSALGKHVTAKDDKTGDAYIVKVKGDDGKVAGKMVRIGLMDRVNAEVKSGLDANSQVVIAVKPATAAKPAGGGGGMRGVPRI